MFKIVKSQFALVVADEDVPNFLFLRTFYDFLSENPQIGSIRTSVQPTKGHKGVNSTIFADKVFQAGALGISEFSVIGNYISGQIWNVKLMNEKGIVQKLEQNAGAQSSYPHLYLNILVAAQAQTMITSAVGVLRDQIMVTVLLMKFQDILVLIATVRELINSSHSETLLWKSFLFRHHQSLSPRIFITRTSDCMPNF